MRLEFLELTPGERQLYFQQAAAQSNLSPVLLEKDFWVSWLLSVLFTSEFSGSLVFKGGTSLSKVFGVINRFSEDIDLSLSPEFLGLSQAVENRNQANKWMDKAEAACAKAVEKQIAPVLEEAVATVLGAPTTKWFEFLIETATDSPVLLFHYPSTQSAGFDYLKRSVKLEFGSLTDQQPTGRHSVSPMMATAIPAAFTDWRCEVVALELERSFWEKATILHREFHRPAGSSTPDRFSRHFADTAALAQHSATSKAINNAEMRQRVVDWKARFFGSAWAHYELAKPGSFKLVPPESRQPELERDYEAMRAMYLSEPATFDKVLEELTKLEHRINEST